MAGNTIPPLAAAEGQSIIQHCPLTVEADSTGTPVSLELRGQQIQVMEVVDRWMIDGGWACGRVARRMYWDCLINTGLRIAVHQDMDTGRWYW